MGDGPADGRQWPGTTWLGRGIWRTVFAAACPLPATALPRSGLTFPTETPAVSVTDCAPSAICPAVVPGFEIRSGMPSGDGSWGVFGRAGAAGVAGTVPVGATDGVRAPPVRRSPTRAGAPGVA